jgi:hypothetical protein
MSSHGVETGAPPARPVLLVILRSSYYLRWRRRNLSLTKAALGPKLFQRPGLLQVGNRVCPSRAEVTALTAEPERGT